MDTNALQKRRRSVILSAPFVIVHAPTNNDALGAWSALLNSLVLWGSLAVPATLSR